MPDINAGHTQGHFSLMRLPSSEASNMSGHWLLPTLIHDQITLQCCFSSEKENGDTQAKSLSLSYCESHIHLGELRETNAKSKKRTEFLDASQSCKGYFSLNDIWHSDGSGARRSKTPTTFYPLKTAPLNFASFTLPRHGNRYNCMNANVNAKCLRRGGAMGVFTRSVSNIPSGKILDKNCEPLYWWQTFR